MREIESCSRERSCLSYSNQSNSGLHDSTYTLKRRKYRRLKLLGPLMITMMLVTLLGSTVYASDAIYQSWNALEAYDTSIYDTVFNANETTSYSYGYTSSQELNSIQGDEMKFRSLIYTEIPNPQSITVSPDGDTAWVLSSYKNYTDNTRTGRIYKVDLKRFWNQKAKGSKDTSAIQEGPEIVTGHGQTLAYNPKSHELWFVRETKVLNTTLVRVNPDTMEVEKEIHFRFGETIVFPPTFIFDKDGNCWTYTRSSGSNWVARGTIRFYKGRIEGDTVSFHMVNQGLRYPPGSECQSFAYNPQNDRLYVVSDGCILTVPATKLSNEQITADDVEAIKFDGCREFEGLAFTEAGCAYFVTNKPSEIMRDEVSYKKAVEIKKKIDAAKKAYKSDKKEMTSETDSQVESIVTEKIGEELDEGL